jgi:hypothetical protein
MTVPPLMAVEANRLELIGAEGSVTLVSAGAGAATSGSQATNRVAGSLAGPHIPLPPEEIAREVNTSAPVAWPVGDSRGPDGARDDITFSTRRDRSRRIVLAVVAAAVVIVILAVLRAAYSTAPHVAGAAGPTTQMVSDDRPAPPPTRAAPPTVASTAPAAQASTALPTSVTTVASAVPVENSQRKVVSAKKRPYRPSGI